jgi:hypothetical protein
MFTDILQKQKINLIKTASLIKEKENMADYNGWTNYETWNVALWMDNSEGSQAYWNERAEELLEDGVEQDDATYKLSKEIEEQHEEYVQDALEKAGAECSFMADIVNGSMREVNWYEIAEHYIDEVVIERKAEESRA